VHCWVHSPNSSSGSLTPLLDLSSINTGANWPIRGHPLAHPPPPRLPLAGSLPPPSSLEADAGEPSPSPSMSDHLPAANDEVCRGLGRCQGGSGSTPSAPIPRHGAVRRLVTVGAPATRRRTVAARTTTSCQR
jgi:hypothetical protein